MNQALKDWWLILTLRPSREIIDRMGWWHFMLGVVATLVVGIGRSWDDSNAEVLRRTGVGSLAYILLFSLVMWMITSPFSSRNDLFHRILIATALTSPPGFLYAFPIEKVSPQGSNATVVYNSVALLVVSIWRVAMMWRILSKGVGIRSSSVASSIALYAGAACFVFGFTGVMADIANSMGGYRGEDEYVGNTLAQYAFLASFPLGLIGFISWLMEIRKGKSD